MTARLAVALLASLACAAPTAAARAQDADPPAYRATIDDAVGEFSAGHYEEARALFKRAHGLSPNARTMRGMGMAAFELRMYVQAMRELDAALREPRKPLDPAMRAHGEGLIAKSRSFVARVRPVLEPAEAKLVVDGGAPVYEADGSLLLDAGTHVLSATLDGYKPSSVRIALEGGSEQSLQMPLEPLPSLATGVPAIDPNAPARSAEPPPLPRQSSPARAEPGTDYQTFAWVTLGGAASFGAAAGAFWVIGSGKYSDLKKQCGTRCTDAEIDDAGVATSDLLTSVFLGAAIASGVASGVLFALSAGQQDEPDSATVRLELGPLFVGVRGTL